MPPGESQQAQRSPLYVAIGSLALWIAGLLLDLATPQTMVVAITYNIPIAFSGLALSRRLTYTMVALALLANLLAGYGNAQVPGGFDAVALANRGLAALSFLLVGIVTLALGRASARVTALQLGEANAKREGRLRRLIEALSGPLHSKDLLGRSCSVLRETFEAEAVIISSLERNRFTAPRYSDPAEFSLAHEAEPVPWAVAAVPSMEPPVLSTQLDIGLLTVGRWRRRNAPELVVLVHRPNVAEPTLLLGEALRSLEPLLERAVLLESLDKQRGELERRNSVIRDLVYAFSHDLRTPLMANTMNMKLALEGAYGELEPEYRRHLQNGLEANQDLLELADSLLLIARFESGEPLGRSEPVDLCRLLREATARLEPVFANKALEVKVTCPETLKVLGRPTELRRVFQNLLDNAARFSPQAGTITARLYEDEESSSAQGIRLDVLDQGPGVSRAQKERLFQRFSSGTAGGGTGLGLYLARQIIQVHGGQIGYEPREGGGSRFTLWLPIAKEVVTA